ncbi:PREDICTED: uncharacterized protein LOC106810734 [Priapulus caudatus]|uniref:Uncharacterized protein LOC106810734 n=1 Tax=Priapulus caudatus TaxID=37621 RepID=A0ABM1EBT9_PRICU|nr:PREDICTED: uncharacterized protein LOC106810734 [Priapulus caudatus]
MFYSKAGFSGVEAYRPRAEFLMRCKNKQIVNFLAEGSATDGEKRASVSLESWFAEPITMGYIFASRSDYYGAAPFNLTDTFIKVGEKCLLGIEANGDASQSRNTYSKSLHYTVTSDYFQTYKVDYDLDYEDGRVNIREYSAKYGSKLLYSLSGTGYVEGYNNGYPA